MKKFFIVGAAGIFFSLFLYMAGCSSQGNPVMTTIPPTATRTNTPTITRTPTITDTPTITNTPNGTFTDTPTVTNTPSNTPSGPTPLPLFTSGGGLYSYDDTVNVYASGAAPADLITFNDSTTPYGSNSYCQSFGVSNWNGSTWVSFALSTDGTAYPSGYNFTPYSNLTFYARTNTAQPSGITIYGDTASVAVALTTSWQLFSLAVPGGTSTQSISVGISNAVSLPVTVYLDSVQYQ